MDDHAGRITIIASSTMVHHRARCLICDRPVDHRVVFMTNDARVLHAGCVPDHVKVPIAVLLQAIRRLERMLARARDDAQPRDDDRAPDSGRHVPDPAATPGPAPAPSPDPAATLRPSPAPSPAATAEPAATPGPDPGATPGLGEPQEPGPVS